MKHVHGIRVFGGTFPAQIWRTFIITALKGRPPAASRKTSPTIHWRRWCGPFQHARNYTDARSTAVCGPDQTRTDQHRSDDNGGDNHLRRHDDDSDPHHHCRYDAGHDGANDDRRAAPDDDDGYDHDHAGHDHCPHDHDA